MAEKLKLCPFCGEKPVAIQPNGLGPISSVFCQNEKCVIFGLQMPVKIWNTRTENPLLAVLEEIVKDAEKYDRLISHSNIVKSKKLIAEQAIAQAKEQE